MPKPEKTETRPQTPPLRVLFIIDALGGGGAEKVLVELLQQLDRSRAQPSLFLLWNRGIYRDSVPKDIEFTWGAEDGEQIRSHFGEFRRRLRRAVAGADVVVGAVELLPSYIGWIAAKLARKPFVAWVHTDLPQYVRYQPSWDRFLAQSLYARFDAVVVPSRAAGESLGEYAGLKSQQVHVIANAINPRRVRALAAEPKPDWLEPILAKPCVMGLGRLVNKDKGWDLVLRAHAKARADGVDHNLVLIGEGPDRDILLSLAKDLGVENSFFLPGFQQNPFPIIRSATSLVLGSKLEGFGLALVEAMALGIPIIALRSSPGPAEILGCGKYGMLVETEDVGGFADAIRRITTCPECRQDYAQRSLERSGQYDFSAAVLWEELLNRVAQG